MKIQMLKLTVYYKMLPLLYMLNCSYEKDEHNIRVEGLLPTPVELTKEFNNNTFQIPKKVVLKGVDENGENRVFKVKSKNSVGVSKLDNVNNIRIILTFDL